MTPDAKANKIVTALRALDLSGERQFIAIAGPPAAGKSTLAGRVCAALEAAGTPCGLVPMDGFHLDNEELAARGLLHRKGAPETFDIEGFSSLLARLKSEEVVRIPVFDRERDQVVEDAQVINAEQRCIVVEGNYLFLDAPGWRDLMAYWSFSVFVSAPLEELATRLTNRWQANGLSLADARHRATGNDLVNADKVLSLSNLESVRLLLA